MFCNNHKTAIGCAALLVVMSLGQSLCKTPLLRILELNLCRTYYTTFNPDVISPSGDVNEKLCKILPVQKELATINAYSVLFSALIELLTAFPYASLCGRFNRRTILVANVGGAVTAFVHTMVICYFYRTFNTKLVWAQSAYRLFGGGDSVLLSLSNALIAETVPVASLSKTLFSLNAIRLFVNAASQTVGARLMQKNLWLPMLVGIGAHGLAIPALFLMEDPRLQRQKLGGAMAATPSMPPGGDSESDPLLGITNSSPNGPPASISHEESSSSSSLLLIWRSFTAAFKAVVVVCRTPIAAPTLVLFFWNEVGHGVNNIIPQWASVTFSWTLADTNYFLAAQRAVAGISLIGLTTAVHWLQGWGVPSARLDLGLVVFCQSVTLVGMLGTIASSLYTSVRGRSVQYVCSVFVYMMGWGMNGALQSTVTRVSHPDDITVLYAGLNVAERLAVMASGPVFAALLAESLKRGGLWEYLPYWTSMGIFLLVSVLTVRLVKMLARV